MEKINNILVTVAIPAYKKQFLKEAIDSVLSQTHSNFELIIVNDCSPEKLDEIVNQYNDARIRYYKNEVNLGKKSIVHNWNKCLSYAKGEFFALLCDDDIMEATFLEEMLLLVDKYPNNNIFKCRTKIIDSTTKNNIFIRETDCWNEYEGTESFLIETIKGNRKHTISEFLYRTVFLKDNNGYIVYPVGYYSDDATILQLVFKDKAIISSSKSLITFRMSKVHISSSSIYNLQKIKATIQYYNWLLKIAPQYKIIINNRIDYDLYANIIKIENIYSFIKILLFIPYNTWPLRKKLIILLKYITK